LSRIRSTHVVIIGAGPYGLSLAAHLNDRKVGCRIFGSPMQMWRERMPKGMVLKSDGFASNLTAGRASFTLENFCNERGYDYDDTRIPVKLEHFVEYGMEFQKRLVPQLEDKDVVAVRRVSGGFRLRLDDGEEIVTPLLVVAAGISHFENVPRVFEGIPERYATHASMHSDLARFAGKKVSILGAGASALEMAAILHELGAETTVIAREKVVRFHDGPKEGKRTLIEELRAPSTPMGPSWRSWMAWKGPHIFRLLPESLRLRIVERHLGPSGGWSIKKRVAGKVPMLLGQKVDNAFIVNGHVHLTLKDAAGTTTEHVAEHVIAATGYRVDMSRLTFLGAGLRAEVRTSKGAPVLSATFQSSVKGLYFIGAASAPTFGPLMRFACGAEYCSTWLSRHLERVSRAKVRRAAMAELQIVER
jgi:thioredoxin reductase